MGERVCERFSDWCFRVMEFSSFLSLSLGWMGTILGVVCRSKVGRYSRYH
jgi:hypothetical protein